ncbi:MULTISPECIES: pro-sigmaK processing inhibitor BofA family protein [Dehalobacter]|uniref:SigmaK-factor processing regulatory BofA n=2 Tax=Dehalobacter restrictus TaxID=55583 RepID=A0A857DFA1_9FIRM|nr:MULTISPECIES: pro-sigmaK processing inhibitor BofA family protein [Dehalobacter]AHF08820.1 SigmaK-factor processing regulatory protein BofA [Dehalobacter restrictus DSM 9455]MCG1024161.1 pro-sigmaK processing inhibitor BofA family protein [Dehalobacter sp.]MDJ0305357.1 pro-sigmaK processing inhibitor BofA family protein [Dehalobacter sp.]OCZ49996.1 sigmaK-factor processing regulatory BofA [Dehalobacter sp. TeCB1]QGZ99317.1 sigmaK-factor processing regulatory BofA [Dehalobacter restrictus]
MTFVFLGLFIVLLILVTVASLRKPNKLINLFIHILGGIVGLWVVDLLLSIFSFEIPINIFTVSVVAILGFPGVIVLAVLQLIGI